jgi:hypothetical protein
MGFSVAQQDCATPTILDSAAFVRANWYVAYLLVLHRLLPLKHRKACDVPSYRQQLRMYWHSGLCCSRLLSLCSAALTSCILQALQASIEVKQKQVRQRYRSKPAAAQSRWTAAAISNPARRLLLAPPQVCSNSRPGVGSCIGIPTSGRC